METSGAPVEIYSLLVETSGAPVATTTCTYLHNCTGTVITKHLALNLLNLLDRLKESLDLPES